MKTTSKRLIVSQIFIIFVLPVILLFFGILSSDWRVVLLAVSFILIYGIIRYEKWTYEEMGLRHDNFKKSFPFYLFFTILSVVVLFLLDHRTKMPDIETTTFLTRTLVLFLPVSFFQEFAFRSFLIPRLKAILRSDHMIILVNATLFALVHVIYPNLIIGLPLAFVSGIFFAWLYMKYPNLLLISLAHSALNVTAVMLGFFNIS
ncbi:CPBP family intramembrane metalloprotease [Patescibacteria group bacterium]|nr:CPBP family intramembrane metalloprotease [Patescibacteria group bacterium]